MRPEKALAASDAINSSRSASSESTQVAKTITLPGGKLSGTTISEYETEPFFLICPVTGGIEMSSASRPRSSFAVSRDSVLLIETLAPATNLTCVPSRRIGATEEFVWSGTYDRHRSAKSVLEPRPFDPGWKAVCAMRR